MKLLQAGPQAPGIRTPAQDDGVDRDAAVGSVQRWVERLVVDLGLCPFAGRELRGGRVRFASSAATTEGDLLTDLRSELERLGTDPSVETTLLIHPQVLQDFHDYNRFLADADRLLGEMDLVGVFQIASFHPDYQFGGSAPEAVENYTNRSPWPLLHLLREDSLERAIAGYPEVDEIPLRNMEQMHQLGREKLRALLRSCFDDTGR